MRLQENPNPVKKQCGSEINNEHSEVLFEGNVPTDEEETSRILREILTIGCF